MINTIPVDFKASITGFLVKETNNQMSKSEQTNMSNNIKKINQEKIISMQRNNSRTVNR